MWITEVLGLGWLGYSGSAYSAARDFAHNRRTSLGRKWVLLIFVGDSPNDTDGKFTNGSFGYAYLAGPYMVIIYNNDGWGINQMDIVTAHYLKVRDYNIATAGGLPGQITRPARAFTPGSTGSHAAGNGSATAAAALLPEQWFTR